MKTKNGELPVKIFLVVVAVILVGFIIAWTTGVFKDKKNDLSRGTEKINSAIGSMAEFDLLVYEGESIKGDTIIDLIKELKEKDLNITITVITNLNQKGSDDTGIEYSKSNQYDVKDYAKDKKNKNYINPNGNFIGKVEKNDNGMLIGITFTQQK